MSRTNGFGNLTHKDNHQLDLHSFLIHQHANYREENIDWKSLQKIHVIPSVLCFCWKLLNGQLPQLSTSRFLA